MSNDIKHMVLIALAVMVFIFLVKSCNDSNLKQLEINTCKDNKGYYYENACHKELK